MNDPLDSIVDILDRNSDISSITGIDREDTGEELMVPRKCAYCKNNVICSVLPSFIGVSKIGIAVGVEECRYYVPTQVTPQIQE